jgi:hypothetical protein
MRQDRKMKKKTSHQFDALGRFILPDFQQARPFSSFLPGIAGTAGIPMWVFYTNRGQAIASFGIESKDRPILEFQPANKAYQQTGTLGFRTFLNLRRGKRAMQYEPFANHAGSDISREMFIGMNEVEIREVNQEIGIETRVLYFLLTDQPFAALVRQVMVRNLADTPLTVELLDGLPALSPYGVNNGMLKDMARTLEAWMEVRHLATRIPFFTLRASAGDSTEVSAIEAGNFALGFTADAERLPVLVDPRLVFGHDTAFDFPQPFATQGLDTLITGTQICEGRTPCAFVAAKLQLSATESQAITSLYGMASSYLLIESRAEQLVSPQFTSNALTQARDLAKELTDPVAVHSAKPLFDAYCRQTFLDNVMRGGWPLLLADKHVYHVFSRKHGDMERDYNYFYLAAEPYSQGNGNFRDVNQNRRSDVFFEPRVEDFNVRAFASLIQSDGYNPLVIEGTVFHLPAEDRAAVLAQVAEPTILGKVLADPFTPGKLMTAIKQSGPYQSPQALFNDILSKASQHLHAEFGEGYWIDHWTYLLDLIDAYLCMYPDKKADLLFEGDGLPFYDSPAVVAPRRERYVISRGKPRQLNGLVEDEEKAALIAERGEDGHWVHDRHGAGEMFRLPLFGKLSLLALLKFCTLDPFGMGIEMEASRPGWNDALNGLPAMFGSSMPETFELLRLVQFLMDCLAELPRESELPREAVILVNAIRAQSAVPDRFTRWQALSDAREEYRRLTRLGFSGERVVLKRALFTTILQEMQAQIQEGIQRAAELTDTIPPTYLMCQPLEYTILDVTDAEGRPYIDVQSFQANPLPPFLEGPMRQMRVISTEEALDLYARVRESELFDQKLSMYRVNGSMEGQPHDIGRLRAFSPGWLENGSIFLHMAYKYLLALLRAGLYDEFFKEVPTNLVPFMDPAVYGRSPLENCSFLVSSVHPDESLHGAGFVARLSGSTAEFLSMWQMMMSGPQPFVVNEGELEMVLQPILPGDWFREDGTLSFCLFGKTTVTYHNPSRRDTYSGLEVDKIILTLNNGEEVTINSAVVPAPFAQQVRHGEANTLHLYFKP